jgi:signal transduction histidine kinase
MTARGQRLVQRLPASPVWITADAECLERAVFNLLDNARKYAPEGTHFQLMLDSRGSEQIVSIHDDGPGIPAEEQAHIFDRFYQGRASSRNEGSRLGLLIARAMVELHGGRIQVASTPGVGSCFTIALPSAPPQPAPAVSVGRA